MYLAGHLARTSRETEVYNPSGRPVDELPVIFGFNNGGTTNWQNGCLLAEDGTELGGHACSNEGYMPFDLGVAKGSRPDRQKDCFRPHYPGGYRMEFVPYSEVRDHSGLQAAFRKAHALDDNPPGPPDPPDPPDKLPVA